LFLEYSKRIHQELISAGDYHVDIDISDHTLNKKIREAQVSQYNFILIVGEKEEQSDTVNVRTREGEVKGEMTLKQLKDDFFQLYNV
jgi:threonyl-tRNA synthetase